MQSVYFTDRGIEELAARRGEEQVSLEWLAEQLRTFVDQHPDFEARELARARRRKAKRDRHQEKNKDAIDAFVAELQKLRPGLRLFLDRQTLQTGCAWQQDIFTALDDCRKIVAFYSPAYLASKVCREEFNIALFRQRDEGGEVLLPIFLHDASLPTYLKMIQYIDCRAGFGVSLAQAAAQLVKKL